MLPVTRKMSSYPTITFTNWWINTNLLAISNLLPIISWKTDVCHCNNITPWNMRVVSNMYSFFALFLVYSSPYFPHLLDAWTKRNHPNLLFVFYEDLKRVVLVTLPFFLISFDHWLSYSKDLRGEILKIGRFLGRYPNEHQLNRMVEHLRIDKFANNKSVNFEHYRWLNFMSPDGRFIRKGERLLSMQSDWTHLFFSLFNLSINICGNYR